MAVIEEDEAKGHEHAHTHGDKPCSGHDNVEKVPYNYWVLEACLLVRCGSRLVRRLRVCVQPSGGLD